MPLFAKVIPTFSKVQNKQRAWCLALDYTPLYSKNLITTDINQSVRYKMYDINLSSSVCSNKIKIYRSLQINAELRS